MSPILAWSAEECSEVDSYLSILPREEGADTCQTHVTDPHRHPQTVTWLGHGGGACLLSNIVTAVHGFNKLSCPEAATVQKPLPHTAIHISLQKISKSLCMLSRLDTDFSGAHCSQLQNKSPLVSHGYSRCLCCPLQQVCAHCQATHR